MAGGETSWYRLRALRHRVGARQWTAIKVDCRCDHGSANKRLSHAGHAPAQFTARYAKLRDAFDSRCHDWHMLAIAVFKRLGRSTILENNIVQTIGSAGESVAAGVVFTIPALLFLDQGERFFNYFNIMTLSIVGGILGVLMMVPLRRALIVKEHGTLPYPEGTACAEVLVAGEKGGSMAGKVFRGLGLAFAYKGLMASSACGRTCRGT